MFARNSLRLALVAVIAALAGALSTSCARAERILVDGIEVYDVRWRSARADVGRRARFELDCSELDYTLLQQVAFRPKQIGVRGCGQREVYTQVGGAWFSSGQSDGATAAQRQIQQQRQQQQIQQSQQR